MLSEVWYFERKNVLLTELFFSPTLHWHLQIVFATKHKIYDLIRLTNNNIIVGIRSSVASPPRRYSNGQLRLYVCQVRNMKTSEAWLGGAMGARPPPLDQWNLWISEVCRPQWMLSPPPLNKLEKCMLKSTKYLHNTYKNTYV